MGVVTGEMFVDGRPLGPAFQRNTGFCLQGDLHDGTATIREAFEFSAILRQDASVPRAEKIAYVDKIVDLLELNDLQDALIMSLGVEQRKRVTIGVELAAKPSLLLFLDEPTSGLDSASAYSIVRFLKKLARAGQAIVCTIHQPSSILIQQYGQFPADSLSKRHLRSKKLQCDMYIVYANIRNRLHISAESRWQRVLLRTCWRKRPGSY